jgi:shikimate kinase/3-dehydroquinate synthase
MPNLILTGFSGTGKTAVGEKAARLLAFAFIDTDREIVRRAGKPIAAIFAEDGEAGFRRMEAVALAEACARRGAVIAAGGGALADPANRELMLRSGVVVCLEATPETVALRLAGQAEGDDGTLVRPLLSEPDALGSDALARIRALKASRQPAYALAHWTVHTDSLTVAEAAQEVLRAWERLRGASDGADGAPGTSDDPLAAVVHTSAGACPIYVGWGILDRLGQWCRAAGLASTCYLFSDTGVFSHHGRRAQRALEEAEIPAHTLTLPPGEQSKSLETASTCYQWLAERRAERGHFLVALGGGVVGDLGGFVAATFNRGIPLVQAPTSLAAMVDASIGGKTAVNLPQGKNLVGLFHQPRLVVADVQTLTTLPPRELASGWAEAIKHGLILDADLFSVFERGAEAIAGLEQPLATEVIRRSAAIKADVVSRDERETLGIRTLLNYGHTVGHALEAATGYGALLHGEAVSVGMAAAARISRGMGLLSADAVARQDRLLERFGLPVRHPGADRDAMRRAMGVDKKTQAGVIQWVLLEEVGRAVLRSDVPPELVEAVLAEVT